jgi:predicted nuclease with TOPRIM domain
MKNKDLTWADIIEEIHKAKTENERLRDELTRKERYIALLEQKCSLLEDSNIRLKKGIPSEETKVKTEDEVMFQGNWYTGL